LGEEVMPMSVLHVHRERVSIDVNPAEHRRIKVCAALRGTTIRNYVLECVRERLRHEPKTTTGVNAALHLDEDPVLKEVWDNTKDAAYDKI
jgi:hypothetical protein